MLPETIGNASLTELVRLAFLIAACIYPIRLTGGIGSELGILRRDALARHPKLRKGATFIGIVTLIRFRIFTYTVLLVNVILICWTLWLIGRPALSAVQPNNEQATVTTITICTIAVVLNVSLYILGALRERTREEFASYLDNHDDLHRS